VPLITLEITQTLLKPPDLSTKHHHVSFHVIVVFILSAIQSVSGFCLTLINGYKQALQTIKQVNSSTTLRGDIRRTAASTNLSPDTLSPSLSESSDSISRSSSTSPAPSRVSPLVSPSLHSADQFSSSLPQPPACEINYDCDYLRPILKLTSTTFGLQSRFSAAAMLNTVELMTAASSSFLDKCVLCIFTVSPLTRLSLPTDYFHTWFINMSSLPLVSSIQSSCQRKPFSPTGTSLLHLWTQHRKSK
jgi:hypothetical protein